MAKVLALGESLLRLSSSRGNRILNATRLDLYYGGAEANVACNLSMLGHGVKYATKLPTDNSLSHNVVRELQRYGVDVSEVLFGDGRLGSYYVEEGSGVRATNIIYDREYSSIAMMEESEWDLDELFEDVELFHITGITLSLSPFWHKYGVELIKEAKDRGIKVSFDMNYRSKMWDYDVAIPTYQEVVQYVDYLSAGYLDAINFFGIEEVEGADWQYYAKGISEKYPNIKYIYGTNRQVLSSNSFKMAGYLWDGENNTGSLSQEYDLMYIIDRIGAGDSYSAGILDGILLGKTPQEIVDFAMAKAALKHTVYGDVNLFNREEIEKFQQGGAHISR